MNRLKSSQVAKFRVYLYKKQGSKCALCGEPIAAGEFTLDHDHKTGHTRGVLHRGCNTLLGKIENNRVRYGLSYKRLFKLSRALKDYLTTDRSKYPLYPSHRTAEEKKARNKKRAASRRLLKKILK